MDFFLRNRYLGSCPNPAPDPRTIYDYNIAYFCPKCGEIWGRIIVSPSGKHHVLTRGCSECGPAWWNNQAGCLCVDDDAWKMPQTQFNNKLPRDVLINDFLALSKLPLD